MKNHENIKNTNKALLVSNIILGCLLIIAMAFLAITIINNNNITASAAPENLLDEAVTLQLNSGEFALQNIPTLNLVEGNTYEITYTYKGETATVQRTALAGNSGNNIGIDGAVTLGDMAENALLLDNNTGLLLIVDKGQFTDLETEPNYSVDNCLIMMTPLNEEATLENLIIESITLKSAKFGTGAIINNVTGGFTTFLTGIGEGIINFFETIVTDGNGGLSVLAIVALSMIGLGIATGIIKYLLARVG